MRSHYLHSYRSYMCRYRLYHQGLSRTCDGQRITHLYYTMRQYQCTESLRSLLLELAISQELGAQSFREVTESVLGIRVEGDYYTVTDETAYTMTLLRMDS